MNQSTPSKPERKPAKRWPRRALLILTILNALAVAGYWFAMNVISERTWWGTILIFLPKLPIAFPGLVLLILSFFVRWSLILPNLAVIGLVFGPVMGFRGYSQLISKPIPRDQDDLVVVSCNIQEYRPDFRQVLAEVKQAKAQVVLFQEATSENELLDEFFQDWEIRKKGEFVVASRFPIADFIPCGIGPFGKRPGVLCRILTPQGPVWIVNVHQMTLRHGIERLSPMSILTNEGGEDFEIETIGRKSEARLLRDLIDQNTKLDLEAGRITLIVGGDFNMTCESNLFREIWGDLKDSFNEMGFGYGYSGLNDTENYWPSNCPWIRIDHVLVSENAKVIRGWTGRGAGSDHRLVGAVIRLSPVEK